MAAWRRKAIEAFPERRSWIERFAYNQVYFFYGTLLPMVRVARSEVAPGSLQKVFAYAAWCLRQHGSMVGVAFYEHLFDDREDWNTVIPYLSPEIICKCWGLWERRPHLAQEDLQELRVRLNYDFLCDGKGHVSVG